MALRTVDITWDAPLAGGGTVDGYNVYRKEGTGTYTKLASVTGLAATDSSVEEGKTYSYVVTAFGPGGESGWSNEVPTPIPFRAPNPPTNVVTKLA